MAIAFPLGLLLGLARTHGDKWLARAATTYVEMYRGTPVLLQLYVLYYGLAPYVRMGPITAAVVGLGMNYAAYEAETHRAGLQAIPVGQMEAARSLGMSVTLALRRIIVPQALKHALPNVTSDFIALLKDSSLVSVITVVELTKRMTITSVDVRSWLVPGAMCAGLYLVMSLPLARIARRLGAARDAKSRTSASGAASAGCSTACRFRSTRASSTRCSASPAWARARCFARSRRSSPSTTATVRVGGATLFVRDRVHEIVRRRIGFVFQQHHLFAHKTAIENVIEAPIHVAKLSLADARERANKLLERLGVADRRDAYPSALSGGEAQRVAIARAMAMQPDVLLLDEPTSALDPARRKDVTELLRGLAAQGTTLVIATHDIPFAREVASLAGMLENGKLVREGAGLLT